MLLKDPLTFKSIDTTTIILNRTGNFNKNVHIKYIRNNIQCDYQIGQKIELNDGQFVSFYNTEKYFSEYFNKYYYFVILGKGQIKVSGNIMSMINYSKKIQSDYQFYKLFFNCKNIIDASQLKLPSKKLKEYCYCSLFKDCQNLLNPPKLPSTKLSLGCYSTMFWGCSKLDVAPQLPAKKLAINCYFAMFYGCSSLTISPTLLAKKLVPGCYENMFENCIKLNTITVYFTDWGIQHDTFRWVNNVAKNGMFNKKEKLKDLFGPENIPPHWLINNIK